MKIVFTGGHAHATALALFNYLAKNKPGWENYWVGPKSLVEGGRVVSLENSEFEKMGVRVFAIYAGRLQRKFTLWTLPSVLKIPVGFFHSFSLLWKLRPDVVFSFGGFVGFPMALSAWILRIPLILHEQTTVAGRANIYASFFARKIALSRLSSAKYFPKEKVVMTGNPIDERILSIKPKKKIGDPPVIFVTGGHTGARVINDVILKIVDKLLAEFVVIHQAGTIDFEKVKKTKLLLNHDLQKRYEIYPVIAPNDWPRFLERSDIVVSRAGANIVSQLMVAKRPAVLIPIPFSYLNEQVHNALFAQTQGLAQLLEQDDLNEMALSKKIYYLRDNWYRILKNAKDASAIDRNACQKITDLIESVSSEN